MRRAQEKLERKLEAQRQRKEHRAQELDRRTRRSWKFEWPAPPAPPARPKPSAPASPPAPSETGGDRGRAPDHLTMLEQKKISLEEADQLLSALEGND